MASALARNDPTLLAKSDPPPPLVEWRFAVGQARFLPRGKWFATGPAAFRRSIRFRYDRQFPAAT